MCNKYFGSYITYGSKKYMYVSTKFPFWDSTCLLFIDSMPGFVVPSLLSGIRLMDQDTFTFKSLKALVSV